MATNNAVIKERSDGSSEYWAERFEEASGWVEHYVDESNRLQSKVQFLMDFIRWKGLSDEYSVFEERAYKKEFPDEPFPRYVMD